MKKRLKLEELRVDSFVVTAIEKRHIVGAVRQTEREGCTYGLVCGTVRSRQC